MFKIFINVFLFFFASISWADGSCVVCHGALKDARLMKTFQTWQSSIHGQQEESCQTCHGGDASSAAKKAAHTGVLKKSHPKSSIHSPNIPKTCGKCHGAILEDFQKSAHFKKISQKEKAPDCVTCHSPKSGFIASVEKMEPLCLHCHENSVPPSAHIIDRAKRLYTFYSVDLKKQRVLSERKMEEGKKEGKKEGKSVPLAGKFFTLSSQYTRLAKASWHSFHLDDFEMKINKAYFLSVEAENLLKKDHE